MLHFPIRLRSGPKILHDRESIGGTTVKMHSKDDLLTNSQYRTDIKSERGGRTDVLSPRGLRNST